MNKILIIIGFFAVFAATTLSFPAIDEENPPDLNGEAQALVALDSDGNPEFVVLGDGDKGRAGISKIQNLLNFTAYLQGRPANVSSINFVPIITILATIAGAG